MEWTQVLTIIATNIALMYWMRQDSKDFMHRIEMWKEQINVEMKDFHVKLEKQDAEYKAHMMYYHDKR